VELKPILLILVVTLSGCATKTSYVSGPSVEPTRVAVSSAQTKGDRMERKAVLIDRWLETHKPKDNQ